MWYEFYTCTHEGKDGWVLSFVPLKLHDEQSEKKGKRKTISKNRNYRSCLK